LGWKALSFKVLIPLVGSPLTGFLVGWIIMSLVGRFLGHADHAKVSEAFKRLQVV
jgi:PiT family inorganic phosphate transporter